jgi:hypothetical protein
MSAVNTCVLVPAESNFRHNQRELFSIFHLVSFLGESRIMVDHSERVHVFEKLFHLFAFAFLPVTNANAMIMRITEVNDTITTEYRSLKFYVVKR